MRRAVAADQPGVERCVAAAYAICKSRLGIRPATMEADYGRLIANTEVRVMDEGGGVTGLLVLEARRDPVLIDDIAVHPDAQGRGLEVRLTGEDAGQPTSEVH